MATMMMTRYNNKSLTSFLSPPPPPPSLYAFSLLPSMRNFKVKMSSPLDQPSAAALPSLPHNRIVLGCGGVGVDYLAAVDSYPKPDDKIRSTSLQVQGGGNAGNALTCAARLGLNPRLISKYVRPITSKPLISLVQDSLPGVYRNYSRELLLATSKHSAASYKEVADDAQGRGILEELQSDRVDTSFLVDVDVIVNI